MKKAELLAAMQALAIYIIMRLDEGETEYNNFDLLLCKTVIVGINPINWTSTTNNQIAHI